MSDSWHINGFLYTQEHGIGKNVSEFVSSQVKKYT